MKEYFTVELNYNDGGTIILKKASTIHFYFDDIAEDGTGDSIIFLDGKEYAFQDNMKIYVDGKQYDWKFQEHIEQTKCVEDDSCYKVLLTDGQVIKSVTGDIKLSDDCTALRVDNEFYPFDKIMRIIDAKK